MSDAIRVMTAEGFAVTPETVAKINAEVNYDLIKKNQHDKFGDGEYISVETVTNILNETFNHTWSWEIITFVDKNDYVICHGRLTIPGLGVRDGIGQAKADKKDNSTMFSAAASFAFKSAAKRIGIAPNIFNKEGIGYDVFEPGTVQEPAYTQPANSYTAQAEAAASATQKPQVQSQKQIPETVQEKATELKEAYQLQTKTQFVAFAQIWNPQITKFEQITLEVIEQLHAYVEANGEEFEDFIASDY